VLASTGIKSGSNVIIGVGSFAIYSTVEDVGKFLRNFFDAFDRDSAVFTEEEANKFFAPQVDLQGGRCMAFGGLYSALDSALPRCESMNRFLAPNAHGARRFGVLADGQSCNVYYKAGLVDGFSAAVYLSLPLRAFVVVLGNGTGPVQVTDHIACGVLQRIVGLEPSVDIVKTAKEHCTEATKRVREVEMADRLPDVLPAAVSRFVGVYEDPISSQRIDIDRGGNITLQRGTKRSSSMRTGIIGDKVRILPGEDGFSLERWNTWEDLNFELRTDWGTFLIDHTGSEVG